VSSPLQFYRTFRTLMQEHGIRHVLTSGMACVEYGIQQTTKDTDWIVHPGNLSKLIDMLQELEGGLTGRNWRIAYRPLFGAPLVEPYLASGWTSHLLIQDDATSSEHHLDFFGKPPRLTVERALADPEARIADRLIVAQMKKTDRDKDWPAVESLSQQAFHFGDPEAVLHLRDPALLADAWKAIPPGNRPDYLIRRPLLSELDDPRHGLSRCLAIERALWEQANKLRYRSYQHEWKEFLRRWRKEDDFAWPADGPFTSQHALVQEAAARHQLPIDPLGGEPGRRDIVAHAKAEVGQVFAADATLLDAISPPWNEILP